MLRAPRVQFARLVAASWMVYGARETALGVDESSGPERVDAASASSAGADAAALRAAIRDSLAAGQQIVLDARVPVVIVSAVLFAVRVPFTIVVVAALAPAGIRALA